MKTEVLSRYALMLLAFFVYSLSAVLSKAASSHELFSTEFIGLLTGGWIMMAIYAVLWQKILYSTKLGIAYLNKSVTLLIILSLSVMLFHEEITIENMFGTILIITGLLVLAWRK